MHVLFSKESSHLHRLYALGFAMLVSIITVGLLRLILLELDMISWPEPSLRELLAALTVLVAAFISFLISTSFKWQYLPMILFGIVLLIVSAYFYKESPEPPPAFVLPFILGILLLVRVY